MAQHTAVTYSCDRCGGELPSKGGVRPWSNASVKMIFHTTEGPGPQFEWKDLCDNCVTTLKAFFLPAPSLYPTSTEKKDAREQLATMLNWANTEATDYVAVRILRIFDRNLKGWYGTRKER